MRWPRWAFGVTAGDRPWLRDLARVIEDLGYDELWVNDVRRASGLDTVAAAHGNTRGLRYAVGVLGLSDHAPAQIVERVRRGDLPAALTLGVGSGSGRSLDGVRRGVAAIRALDPPLAIALAAVGPRMARLGGEIADAVLLNWAGPRLAAERRLAVEAGASEAGRPVPRIAAYVRVAVGMGAALRLAREQARYARYGGTYETVIDEQVARGETPLGIAAEDPGVMADALDAYRSVLDTVVVRGIPPDDRLESWLEIARAARLQA